MINVNILYSKPLKNILINEKISCNSQILIDAVCAMICLLAASKPFHNNCQPIGIALTAAVPFKVSFLTFLSASTNYLFANNLLYTTKYVSCTIAICLVRWALNDLKFEQKKLYQPIVCGALLFLADIPVYTSSGFTAENFLNSVKNAVFTGTVTYFFKSTITLLRNFKRNVGK